MTLIQELSNNLLPIVALTAFGWYISHFAKSTIPRLFWFSIGAYLAILGNTSFDNFIGLGFVLPHIKFFFNWIVEVILSIKRGTLDLYYTMLTTYYQTRNIYLRAYRFFTGKNTSQDKKSTGNSHGYYEEQGYKEYEDFGQNSNYQNRKKQRQKTREEEQSYQEESHSNYEEPKQEQTYQEEKKAEDDIPSQYKPFFSDSAYTILGVSPNDDCNFLKKKWRKLQREFHPDLHMDEEDLYKLYTEITARINGAYSTVKKINNCK